MYWLSIFQEASLCTFKCDSSIHNFVIINYSGILSDPNSTKKPRGVLGKFVITRKTYVFESLQVAKGTHPPKIPRKRLFVY